MAIENKLNDIYRVINDNDYYLTRFLDLNEQSIINSKFNCDISYFGGFDNAERVKAIINLKNAPISQFKITILAFDQSKNRPFTHRNVLGAIMSLGIDRSYIGDIVINEEIYIMVDNEMADYLIDNLKMINHEPIKIKKVSYQQVNKNNHEVLENIIISSFRLDNIIEHAFKMSRENAQELIKASKAFINNKEITKVDYLVTQSDIISLRGFGRIKVIEEIGITKKNKIIIQIKKY